MAMDSVSDAEKEALDQMERKPLLGSEVKYNAKDSIVFSLEDGAQVVYLYKGASLKYESIDLTADYIVLNLDKKELYAEGLTDSTGEVTGKPHFVEGSEEFDCGSLRYNFETGKGFIEDVVTTQEDGLVRSAKAKMMSKDVYCMVDGKYSTCDAEHPHFYLNMTKGKVVREKSIITGRAYMVLEDFPIYFPFLPYGLIPTFNKSYSSGVIIPSYGSENRYGYYLKNGGFYWAASDYFDLKLTGDVYSSGKWALNAETRYRLKYKWSGGFRLSYSMAKSGLAGFNQSATPNFSITWNHSQDAKSNPSRTFSASVNYSTSGYDREESYEDPTKYVQNTKSSSITYRKNFLNSPFSLTGNFRINQNTKNQSIAVTLPSMALTMKSIQPFKKADLKGGMKVLKDIKFSYSAKIDNKINTTDSLLFKTPLSEWQKGVSHSLPITLPTFSLFKHINVVPSVSYAERWYFDYIDKYWVDGHYVTDNDGVDHWVSGGVEERKMDGFKRNYDFSGSLSTNTTLYAMYTMKNPNSKVVAIRHKIDPNLSFSYHPDFGNDWFGFYDMVQVDSLGTMSSYNIFQDGVFGSTGAGRSGSINFGIGNNIEMKLVNDKDTTSNEKYRKVAIFDNLSISSSYNLAAKSYKLSPFSLNARTKIAGTSINVTGTLNPYALDEKNAIKDAYTWNEYQGMAKLGRLTRVSTGFSMNYSSDKLDKKKKEKLKEAGVEEKEYVNPNYAPVNMPWRVSGNYSFSYVNNNGSPKLIQTVSVNGSLDLTQKWKTTFNSGFDLAAMKMTRSVFTVTRNLHCWTMSFNFSPFGTAPFYTFTLAANSSMLKDLKIDKSSRD